LPPLHALCKLSVVIIHELLRLFASRSNMVVRSLLTLDAGLSITLSTSNEFPCFLLDSSLLDVTAASFVRTIDRVGRRVFFQYAEVTHENVMVQMLLQRLHVDTSPT
jgi:hypothetical protein